MAPMGYILGVWPRIKSKLGQKTFSFYFANGFQEIHMKLVFFKAHWNYFQKYLKYGPQRQSIEVLSDPW